MTLSMSVFITITIRKTITSRTIATRRTRKGGDNQLPIGMETGDLVTGRRTSQDQPRNTDDNDYYDYEHRHSFPLLYLKASC
jgi:hypothetical protein